MFIIIAVISLFSVQIQVAANDLGSPNRATTIPVTVAVERNLHAPVITSPQGPVHSATVAILETIDFNYLIYTVRATDLDDKVSSRINTECNKESI